MSLQRLLSVMRKGVEKYKMIKDGDKIAVGISGGKDSVTLLKLLTEFKKFAPYKFDLVAISIDLNFKENPMDFSPIQKLCDELGVLYVVEKTDIGEIVFDLRKETNPCSLCSKMRKGALYDVAVKNGCNKVAIGHHADDLIDTFILSLFYEGRLSTFAPKSYLDRTGLVLIRPMVMIEEPLITAYSKELPIVESKCPANKQTKREYAKEVISQIGTDVKNIREMIFTALTHPDRYNLFDKFESEIDKF
ncbi:MAG: tRNA 2-thiocytidine biosynthesis protein TtcA [Clostridia bacterium]|nr:tRNA 2-thiocytidine biosynthesis protein TtcA [Clostridia bacterium]